MKLLTNKILLNLQETRQRGIDSVEYGIEYEASHYKG